MESKLPDHESATTSVLDPLLRHNYFPTQRRLREEIAPLLSSVTFAPEVARSLDVQKLTENRKRSGFDVLPYRISRANGLSRWCGVPHPLGYSKLVIAIDNNWKELSKRIQSENSQIQPSKHPDGRMFAFDYEQSTDRDESDWGRSFGSSVIASADIANFYDTLYSHSIPWAIAGMSEAKRQRSKSLWFNQLDESVTRCQRNETLGLPVGPGTSNIFAELILARVDSDLRSKNFRFVRYVDDYTCWCNDESEARRFLSELEGSLNAYRLRLNGRKSRIQALPVPSPNWWVSELNLFAPIKGANHARLGAHAINRALKLAGECPDGAVMKYALRMVASIEDADFFDGRTVTQVLSLAFHDSTLMPAIQPYIEKAALFGQSHYQEQLLALTARHAERRYSDAVCWGLYLLARLAIEPTNALIDQVLAMDDPISIACLLQIGNRRCATRIVDHCSHIDQSDIYALDRNWVLLYQLFARDDIPNPYKNEKTFDTLRDNAVNFLTPVKLLCDDFDDDRTLAVSRDPG
ncbi:MAG: antiviral reverse transcriptase Drt4 [Planctomycetota bacterium]